MRTRKEDRIISSSQEKLLELIRVYHDGIATNEYEILLNEYKKLYKRYEKTIKVADSVEYSIMEKNESLNDNLSYTIKIARDKLYENINEHKKTKITLLNYKQKISAAKDLLDKLLAEKINMEETLNDYKEHFGQTLEEFNNINKESFENMSLEKILSLLFSKNKKDYELIRLKVKDFNHNDINKIINKCEDSLKHSIIKNIDNVLKEKE